MKGRHKLIESIVSIVTALNLYSLVMIHGIITREYNNYELRKVVQESTANHKGRGGVIHSIDKKKLGHSFVKTLCYSFFCGDFNISLYID
jgi:hypothetical protein